MDFEDDDENLEDEKVDVQKKAEIKKP